MALAFLAMLVLPVASSEVATDLEKSLDCLTDKKVDIVFVFDTSGSMGGEINELSATAKDFATDLEASRIDHRLGLVEFRDFPKTCSESKGTSCGSPGDFAYRVKGDGNLTGDISTFGSWLKELKASGGADGPEAILAALRHAISDCHWRSDAEKVIIVVTDAGPHPDGDCCNAEGDTLDGTIFGLTGYGARVHVIGPEDAALKRIAGETGGQFFKIRSGLSLKPLLKEITGAMSCSFKVEAETTCLNRTLEAKVRLVGKEVIPFVAGQTEAWMYLDQAGSKSRYNLSYDQAAGAYLANVSDVCGPVELTVYGRVGERSAVQTAKVVCGTCGAEGPAQNTSNQPPEITSLMADPASPQNVGAAITWTVEAKDPDGDQMLYRFLQDDEPKTDWQTEDRWIWTASEAGSYQIEAWVRDGKHAGSGGLDDRRSERFEINVPETIEKGQVDLGTNIPPVINSLMPDKTSPQNAGTAITWTANTTDPDGDQILYRFFLNETPVSDWTTDKSLIWTTTDANLGDNWIEVQARDGKHAGPGGLDDRKSANFKIINKAESPVQFAPIIETDSGSWNKTFEATAGLSSRSVQQTSDGGYIATGHTYLDQDRTWLIKTDANGNKLWEKAFGGPGDGNSVQQTKDGGYIITGTKYSNVPNKSSAIWLIKTDANGNKLWDRTFGGKYNDSGWEVQETSDGGYIITGTSFVGTIDLGTTFSSLGGSDILLIKTDADGNAIWNKTFSISEQYEDTLKSSVQQTNDGGFIITGKQCHGYRYAYSSAVWLIKTDANGNKLWDRNFGGIKRDLGLSVQQTNDGGYIIAGREEEADLGGDGVWLIKTDADGNELWNMTYKGEDGASVQQTRDGGYIITGSTTVYKEGDNLECIRLLLIKTDTDGNKLWDKTFGVSNKGGMGSSVQQTIDGGYIILGTQTVTLDDHSYSSGGTWLIKTDSNGN